MAGISVAKRAREEARRQRLERARTGPAASWQEMREAIEAAEEAIAYARALAVRRADATALRETDALKRQVRKVARQAFGGSQVYVLKRTGARLVKIGVTTNLGQRMRALANGGGAELELLVAFPGERGDEQQLHERFAQHRKRGEWFEYAPAIARWVREMQLTSKARG